jgi:hypothetical protein
MQVSVPVPKHGFVLTIPIDNTQVPVPTLRSGTLVATIAFKSYGPDIENMQTSVPVINSGTLVVTITYKSYGPDIETMQLPTPALRSATLVVTINYVNYTNGVTFNPDPMKVSVPALLSGTLV